MNDKQQLAAMGEHLADQAEQAAQPMCMAKRIEELEAQVRVMAGLLLELRDGAEIHLHNCTVCKNEQGIANWAGKLERIDTALAGQVPAPAVPEGWQLVPVQLTPEMWDAMNAGYQSPACSWQAALSAAQKPEDK